MQVLLFRVPEAAAQLGISRAKLYALISSGALPSVRVDGCRRIRRDDLEAFVENLQSIA
jgi:excisionase family DNA binding protein